MLHLLPKPRQLTMMAGEFSITPDMCIVIAPGCGMLARTGAKQLQAEIASACGLTVDIRCGKAREGDVFLAVQTAEPQQGYTIAVDADMVRVVGNDEAGLLHGVQTLRQIIRQSGWTLTAMSITDAPVYLVRGFYHDQTRGRIGKLAWLKQLADECCFYKLNHLELYVEHTYLYRDLTELWATAVDPLTPEDIMALDDYCAERGVELVPSMSSFGHLLELLRTKTYAPLCETENSDTMPSTMFNRMAHLTIDPCNPVSFELVASMLDEYMALFRTDKFNICADETFDLGKGRNKGKSEEELYMPFVKKLCEHVASTGRTPLFWGDIVMRFPEAVNQLPQGTICLNWGYSESVTEDGTRTLAEAGATQYLCPGTRGWNTFIPLMNASHENIRRMAEYGRKYGAVGFLNTDWGDYGNINDPRFSIPGLAAGACASWGELPAPEALWESLSVLSYGDRSGQVLKHVAALSEAMVYSWWNIVNHKEWKQGRFERPDDPLTVKDAVLIMAADETIARETAALKACVLHMDTTQRGMISRWLLGAEAIQLWNHAAHAVASGERDAALAMRMERWLRRYQAMWREVSQESELWRIRDIAVWYANELR